MFLFGKSKLNKKQMLEMGKKAIETEIAGLNSILLKSIDEKFCKFVDIILDTKGKIIFSAIGKPGYIAQKSAATFASTGTPAFYIHPSEASHGDLGMITKNDIVVILSNSGGSSELNDIISYAKRIGIKVVGITRREKSVVAESSDLAIVLENCAQTNPVNSPTTDIIMFLSYLDAVATVLIGARNFTNNEYKNFHPGGKLGGALIRTDEIMRTGSAIPIIDINKTVPELLEEMNIKQLGCCAITDSNKLVGIVTDGDLRRKTIEYGDIIRKKISDLMTKNPKYILSNTLAIEAVPLMTTDDRYRQVLLVLDEKKKKIVGILHIQDLFKARLI